MMQQSSGLQTYRSCRCVDVSLPVQMTDENSKSGPVDPWKTPDDVFVAVQPLSLLRDF